MPRAACCVLRVCASCCLVPAAGRRLCALRVAHHVVCRTLHVAGCVRAACCASRCLFRVMLPVVRCKSCCMLLAARALMRGCMLRGCMPHVAWCGSSAARWCCVLHLAGCTSYGSCCTLLATRCIVRDACRTLHLQKAPPACCNMYGSMLHVAYYDAQHTARVLATRQRHCNAPALCWFPPTRSLTGTAACSAHAGRLQLRYWAPTAAGCSRRRPPWPVRSSRSGVPQYPRRRVLPVPPPWPMRSSRKQATTQAVGKSSGARSAYSCASARVCLFAPQS